jgi:hypothetical protein
MDVDLKNIKRRERRFYRTYNDNGEIKYVDKQTKTPESVTVQKSEDIKIKQTEEKSKEINTQDKKEIIDKILSEMDKSINPNIDEISEVIYSQLTNNNIEVSQETVKHVVEENAHVRRSRRQEDKAESKEGFDYLNDRKEMELVLDNIVEENIKEQTREKNKPKIEKPVIEKKTETHSRRDKKPEEKTKVEEKPEKKKEDTSKTKTKVKKEEEFKLDFGDEDSEVDDQSDDDLGLKF